MHKALICSGFAAAFLVATAASAQEQYYSTLNYYRHRLARAQEHCKGDTVLWLNTKTGHIIKPGSNGYGTTEQGHYVCQKEMTGKYGTEQQEPGSQSQPPAQEPASQPK